MTSFRLVTSAGMPARVKVIAAGVRTMVAAAGAGPAKHRRSYEEAQSAE